MVAKLQDIEVTARWHNIWLGCSVFFLMTTGLFTGLFLSKELNHSPTLSVKEPLVFFTLAPTGSIKMT